MIKQAITARTVGMEPEYLNERQAAVWMGISASLLRKRRFLGLTPRYTKLGRSVRYHRSDLHEWANEERR